MYPPHSIHQPSKRFATKLLLPSFAAFTCIFASCEQKNVESVNPIIEQQNIQPEQLEIESVKPSKIDSFSQSQENAATHVPPVPSQSTTGQPLAPETTPQSPSPPVDPMPTPASETSNFDPTQIRLSSAAENHFALTLAKEFFKQGDDTSLDNQVFSPTSASASLQALWLGTRSSTAQEMANLWNIQLKSKQSSQDLSNPSSLGSSAHPGDPTASTTAPDSSALYQTQSANALWLDDAFPPLENYRKLIQQRLKAEIHSISLQEDPAKLLSSINEWASRSTSGRIPELITGSALRPPLHLIALNTALLKATWKTPFDPAATQPGEFALPDGSKAKADFMNGSIEGSYASISDAGLEVLALPFSSGTLQLIYLLPSQTASETPGASLRKLEANLNLSSLELWLSKLSPGKIDASLPKTDLSSEVNLSQILPALGVKKIFHSGEADFTGLSNVPGLYVTQLSQRVTLRLDEHGAEAAAATVAVVSAKSMERGIPFRVDRPSLILVRDSVTGTIHFMARYSRPAPQVTAASSPLPASTH